MTTKILVSGATGNVGSEVAAGLVGVAPLRVAAYQVEHAAALLGSAPEYVAFDFLNPATFAHTFANIEKMFLVRPPALANVKRDIAPALVAARAAGVKHIVFLSLQGVEKNPVVPHHKIEKLIIELGFTYTFLRASFFMQNLSTTHAVDIRDRDEIALPVGGAKTSFIDVRDIGAVAVHTLTHAGHEDKAYTLTGAEALDYYQIAEIMSEVLGRTIRYTNPSVVSFVQRERAAGRPLQMSLVMAALYTITRWGNASKVTDDVPRILGRAPLSFRQFVANYRTCWLPQSSRQSSREQADDAPE